MNSRVSRPASAWCFTENQEPEALLQALQNDGLPEGIRYLVAGLEIAPSTGQLHLQGYCQLKPQQRLSWLKKNLSHTAHFEPAKGTYQDNYLYCTKDGDFQEFGDPVLGKGQRTDLQALVDKASSSASMKEIATSFPAQYIRYHRGIEKFVTLVRAKGPRKAPFEIIVFYGPPGCGKTSTAQELWPGLYAKPPQSKWWDGYTGEETVLFDDHNSAWFTWDYLMLLIDPYGLPMTVETKGGTVELSATRYVFTCNTHPKEWYHDKAGLWAALDRRILTFVEWFRFSDAAPWQITACKGTLPW